MDTVETAVPADSGTKVKRKRPRKWGAMPTVAFTIAMLESAKNGETLTEFATEVAENVAEPSVDIGKLSNDQQTEFRNKCAAKVSNIRRMLTGKLPSKRGGVEMSEDEKQKFLTASQNLRNALFSLNGEKIPPIDGKRIPRLKGASAGRSITATQDEVAKLRELLGMM